MSSSDGQPNLLRAVCNAADEAEQSERIIAVKSFTMQGVYLEDYVKVCQASIITHEIM